MRRLLPPTLVLLLASIAVPLGLLVPIVGPPTWPWRVAGVVPLVGGLWLTQSGNGLFTRLEATIGTFDDPNVLVTSGPFAYTRNPMYLGFTVLLVGVAVLVGSLTAWVAPIAFALAAARWYIPFEEKRMHATFGVQYDEYVARVPRWLGLLGRKR